MRRWETILASGFLTSPTNGFRPQETQQPTANAKHLIVANLAAAVCRVVGVISGLSVPLTHKISGTKTLGWKGAPIQPFSPLKSGVDRTREPSKIDS